MSIKTITTTETELDIEHVKQQIRDAIVRVHTAEVELDADLKAYAAHHAAKRGGK